MYQRYYKQRKFGRFFGFFTVIGSGIYHFAKININYVKSFFTTKNLLNYGDYLPGNVKSILEFLEESQHSNLNKFFERSQNSLENERNFQIYKQNLDRLSNSSYKKENFSIKNPYEKEITSHSSIDILYSSANHSSDNDYDFKRKEMEKETYLLLKRHNPLKEKFHLKI